LIRKVSNELLGNAGSVYAYRKGNTILTGNGEVL
jgi:hypothetical protein